MKTIIIPGNPIPKLRPRFARRGKFVTTYTVQETEEAKFLLMFLQQWDGIPISNKAIRVKLAFYMKRPKAHYGTGKNAGKLKPNAPFSHAKRPDLDNMIKWVLDCLNGSVWKDDSLISSISARKVYDENPRTEIEF